MSEVVLQKHSQPIACMVRPPGASLYFHPVLAGLPGLPTSPRVKTVNHGDGPLDADSGNRSFLVHRVDIDPGDAGLPSLHHLRLD